MSKFRFLIGGELVDGSREMDVINPADETVFTTAPRATAADIDAAVAAAKAAFPSWAATPLAQRQQVLLKIAEVAAANADELARLLVLEQGKPLPMAKGEVMALAGFFRNFAAVDVPVKVLEDSETRRVELHRRPLGVVATIVPWNFPLALLGAKVPAALVAGNTVVVKPAGTTPVATLRLGELVRDVVPAGVLNVLADANDLGAELTGHPDVRKISFTGSTATGKRVMATAADSLKRITLELGGNDAGIVLDDADPASVAPDIFRFAFVNSGQVCFALKRLYVHESIYDALVDELVKLADAAVVGDGMEPGVGMGPVQNKAQFERVKDLLEDARLHGQIVAGGEPLDRPGYFLRPTIVRDITDGARLVDEEQFAPILPVVKYSDVEDAIRRTNASDFGLGGSVWSSDPERGAQVAARLESGSVWVNKHGDLGAGIPFAGAKSSGLGDEEGVGIEEMTQLQIINVRK